MTDIAQISTHIEMSDILYQYWDPFIETHKVNHHHFKVVQSIINCRTHILGGHIEKCSNHDCDYETNAYNSCRDRHCPKCLNSKKIKWVFDRINELLPIPYFHNTCTMPPMLHRLCKTQCPPAPLLILSGDVHHRRYRIGGVLGGVLHVRHPRCVAEFHVRLRHDGF